MKVYFNGLGVVTGVDTAGDSLRQGSVNVSLEAIFDGIDNSYYSAKFDFTRNDGSRISGVVMQWDSEDGEAFRYSFGDAWFFAKSGQTSLTIYLYDSEGTVIAQGQVQFNIEETDYGDEPTITVNQFNSLMTALASKIGMPSSSLRVDELPETGDVGVFYVVHDEEDDPTRANIYVWNRDTEAYLWVGSNELDLNKYYTKEEGGAFEETVNQRVTSVESELESVASGSPKGVFGTLADLRNAYPSGDGSIYVVLEDGKWYFWNGSAWTAGGQYLESGVGDDVGLLNRINLVDLLSQGKYDSLIQGSYVNLNGIEMANANYQEYVYNSPRFRYIKIGGYGTSTVSAIAFYSSEQRNAITLISVVPYYPTGDGDSIYEKYAEVPTACRCVVFSTRRDKDGVYAYGPAYDYLYETFISKSDGGELVEGVISSENDELSQKVYFGNGRIAVQDTDDGEYTYFDSGSIEVGGNKFYYPVWAEKRGHLITDKWSGFSDYLTKADAEEEYAKKTDLNGYATKKDFDDLKSVVYGIHSLTYNSYEFDYLTSSIIPDEVDGRKTVGGSYAIMDWVGGNSFAFNQLANTQEASTETINGVSFTNNGDGSLTINGTATADIIKRICTIAMPQNHRYLMKGCPNGGSFSTYYLRNDNRPQEARVDIGAGVIDTWDYTFTWALQIVIKSGTTINNLIFRPQVFDLTKMPLDNITSVDEFKALFPLDYYPYQESNIKSTIVSKIESWGANLFNGEFEQGGIDGSTGQEISADTRCRTDYLEVIGGKTYYLNLYNTTDYSIMVAVAYDKDKKHIQNINVTSLSNGLALPLNAKYLRFVVRRVDNGNVAPSDLANIQFMLGCIKPYVPYVGKFGQINIPNAPLKLDGVNDIHNTLAFEEQSDGSYNAILTGKFGIVDLGTLNWSVESTGTSDVYRLKGTGIESEILKPSSSSQKASVLCPRYATKTMTDTYNIVTCIAVSPTDGRISVYDPNYNGSGSATDFKSAMSGVNLLYPLATPTTEVIATGLTFEQVSFLTEKGGTIKAIYEEVPPTASVDFMTKGE